jgi:hypothetical protein
MSWTSLEPRPLGSLQTPPSSLRVYYVIYYPKFRPIVAKLLLHPQATLYSMCVTDSVNWGPVMRQ